MNFNIQIASAAHIHLAVTICLEYATSAKARGTGIAKRSPAYVIEKMKKENAIIAFSEEGEWAGFCYVETWSHGRYVANSGLIVAPKFRKMALARRIKQAVFLLARNKYPQAKVFGITTSLAVMKINSKLGYQPVTFSELPQEDAFWKGCQSCPNHDILQRNKRKLCLCTGMLAPSKEDTMSFDLSHTILVAESSELSIDINEKHIVKQVIV